MGQHLLSWILESIWAQANAKYIACKENEKNGANI